MTGIPRRWVQKTVYELRRQGQPVPEWLSDLVRTDFRERSDKLVSLAAALYMEAALTYSDTVEWVDPLTGIPNRHAIRGWQPLSYQELIVEVWAEDRSMYARFGQLEDACDGVIFLQVDDVRFIASQSGSTGGTFGSLGGQVRGR